MKKLLLSIIATTACAAAFASSPATFPITCANNVTINQTSKLIDVRKCMITKEETSDGMYKVEFTDNNKNKYSCYFAQNKSVSAINHCTK